MPSEQDAGPAQSSNVLACHAMLDIRLRCFSMQCWAWNPRMQCQIWWSSASACSIRHVDYVRQHAMLGSMLKCFGMQCRACSSSLPICNIRNEPQVLQRAMQHFNAGRQPYPAASCCVFCTKFWATTSGMAYSVPPHLATRCHMNRTTLHEVVHSATCFGMPCRLADLPDDQLLRLFRQALRHEQPSLIDLPASPSHWSESKPAPESRPTPALRSNSRPVASSRSAAATSSQPEAANGAELHEDGAAAEQEDAASASSNASLDVQPSPASLFRSSANDEQPLARGRPGENGDRIRVADSIPNQQVRPSSAEINGPREHAPGNAIGFGFGQRLKLGSWKRPALPELPHMPQFSMDSLPMLKGLISQDRIPAVVTPAPSRPLQEQSQQQPPQQLQQQPANFNGAEQKPVDTLTRSSPNAGTSLEQPTAGDQTSGAADTGRAWPVANCDCLDSPA